MHTTNDTHRSGRGRSHPRPRRRLRRLGQEPGVAGAQKTQSSTLVGAGSTLVAPLVSPVAGPVLHGHGVTVTYGAIGSGGGIEQITSSTVDFGASDAPLSPDQAKACKGCVQIPWALAATTVSYNLPGLAKPLRLSGPVIADMYLGHDQEVERPAHPAPQPGVKLPSTPIGGLSQRCERRHIRLHQLPLARQPGVEVEVGVGTPVSWPTGAGAAKNSGVAAAMQ